MDVSLSRGKGAFANRYRYFIPYIYVYVSRSVTVKKNDKNMKPIKLMTIGESSSLSIDKT